MNAELKAANENEELWDANDAARFLKVSRSWVYQRAEAGLLPHVRIGALLRFEPWTLREFARQEREGITDVMGRLRRKPGTKA
ncbi:MAG: helix-turn-helix domain-containing protein [Deltaproteobacteria bacterium]|nr:helix-turn-helix domain-containing protein [Deltaproteobacteria bacterium]